MKREHDNRPGRKLVDTGTVLLLLSFGIGMVSGFFYQSEGADDPTPLHELYWPLATVAVLLFIASVGALVLGLMQAIGGGLGIPKPKEGIDDIVDNF